MGTHHQVKIDLSSESDIMYFKPAATAVKNAKIKKGDLLGMYSVNNSSCSLKLKSPCSGVILSVNQRGQYLSPPYENDEDEELMNPDPKVIVAEIEECQHLLIYNQVCVECLEPRPQQKAFIFSGSENLFLNEKLIDEKIKGLVVQKRLILLLDLDNTVVHSIQVSKEYMEEFVNSKKEEDVYGFELENGTCMLTKLRPHFWEFYSKISSLFEIYIYTFGTRAYAERVLKLVDPEEKALKAS